jgi:hypothetical protein
VSHDPLAYRFAQLIIEEVSGFPFENPSVFKGQRAPEGNV